MFYSSYETTLQLSEVLFPKNDVKPIHLLLSEYEYQLTTVVPKETIVPLTVYCAALMVLDCLHQNKLYKESGTLPKTDFCC